MGLFTKLKKNEKLSLKDLEVLKEKEKEVEKQLLKQKQEKENKLYRIKCEKCGTEIKLNSGSAVQRVYCSNKDCLRKYYVKTSLPSDNKVKTGSLTSEDWIKGNVDQSLQANLKVEKPKFEVTHIGYAWEDRLTFDAVDLSSEVLFLRISESKKLNNQKAIIEDLTELVRRIYYR